ncbi:MAG TPA: hypothetical protein VG347_02280 [Verrucomicrobiae bacterium]|nr:hypothetical protein [Verrucomicrobiae bacterium]
MKTFLFGMVLLGLMPSGWSATTIDTANRYAYAADLGWLDWHGNAGDGVVIGEYVCSGYIYSANVGWISLGSGVPANGVQYQNNLAADFGVNQDGLGNLRGYAYGANIGWLNFENLGAPKVDLLTGKFAGYVYGANCGWISLSNAVAYVQTGSIQPGVLATNGLPIAWLLQNFGTTNVSAAADPDHDGVSNLNEYLVGTDPNNGADYLRITGESFGRGGTNATLAWTSKLTRYYHVQKILFLNSTNWTDSPLGVTSPDGNSTSRSFSDTNAPVRFYRVEAVRPLMQ